MNHRWLTILMLAFTASGALCCSEAPLQLQSVSSQLTIAVTHREKPIAGVEITVIPEGSADPVFTGFSDSRGLVFIKLEPRRHYYVTASHENFPTPKQWIQVVSAKNTKAKRRLNLQWADWSYQTREVTGTLSGLVPGDTGKRLMDLVHPKETFYTGVELTLKDAFSETSYRTISDSTGSFIFPHVPSGIYILHIAGGGKVLRKRR